MGDYLRKLKGAEHAYQVCEKTASYARNIPGAQVQPSSTANLLTVDLSNTNRPDYWASWLGRKARINHHPSLRRRIFGRKLHKRTDF